MRHVVTVALAAGVIAAAVQPAVAQDSVKGKRLLVVPLAGDAANLAPGLQADLTKAVQSAADGAGARTEMAQTSLDDLLMINGCTIEQRTCLRNIARTLGVDVMVVGDVTGSEREGLSVRLVRVPVKGEIAEKRISLAAGPGNQMAQELSASATELFPGAQPPPEKPREAPPMEDTAPPPVQPPGPADSAPSAGFSLGAVKPYAWGIAGGGAALAVIGGVFLLSAGSVQDDIDAAPIDTFEDLDRLRTLEDTARSRYLIGDVALITGAVAVGVGVGLIVVQARSGAEPERQVALSPLIIPGGAGIAVTFGSPARPR